MFAPYTRSMVSALEVFEALGAGVVSVVVPGELRDVSDVFVWGDASDVPPGSIVAAVGVLDERAQDAVIRTGHTGGASAVVFRGPVSGAVADLASACGLTVCRLDADVGWADLVFYARAFLQRLEVDLDAATAHHELFAIADAIAATLAAPVTIEDARHRVLAYAAPEGLGDLTRTSTILGRAVPPEVVRRLRSAGVFRRLATTDAAFVVPSMGAELQQRVVVPIRMSSRALGSMWIVRDGDLTPDVRDELASAAADAARLMVHLMAHEDIESRLATSSVRRALRGDDADGVIDVLAAPGTPVRVVVLAAADARSSREHVALWRAVLRREGWGEPVIADVDGEVFMVVHDRPGPAGWKWLTQVVAAAGAGVVAASRAATSPADLVELRQEALDVRSAMRGEATSVRYEDVWSSLVTARATGVLARSDRAWLAPLASSGSGRSPALAETTLAWLLQWGDVVATARELGVHPNTVRQRLKKARSVMSDVDLDAPGERLAAVLVLLSSSGQDAR